MSRLTPFALAATLLASACSAPTSAPASAPKRTPVTEASVREGLNDRFLDPELDLQRFLDLFEGESREIAASRDGIVGTLGLRKGMMVADIGAGTGLFLDPLAAGVGPRGRIYAVDISPRFLEHLRERTKAEPDLRNVTVVEGGANDPRLPDSSVDLALIVDTYHHFEFPRTMMSALHAALRPGGRVLVVDFERIPGVTREWVLGHVRAGKEVFRDEILSCGFELVREHDVDGLEENYVLEFRRLDG